jgi:hypothetical protein
MKPNNYILAYTMFAAAIFATAGSAPGPANHRHAGFGQRHHNR